MESVRLKVPNSVWSLVIEDSNENNLIDGDEVIAELPYEDSETKEQFMFRSTDPACIRDALFDAGIFNKTLLGFQFDQVKNTFDSLKGLRSEADVDGFMSLAHSAGFYFYRRDVFSHVVQNLMTRISAITHKDISCHSTYDFSQDEYGETAQQLMTYAENFAREVEIFDCNKIKPIFPI